MLAAVRDGVCRGQRGTTRLTGSVMVSRSASSPAGRRPEPFAEWSRDHVAGHAEHAQGIDRRGRNPPSVDAAVIDLHAIDLNPSTDQDRDRASGASALRVASGSS
jgi:hypothetical protein